MTRLGLPERRDEVRRAAASVALGARALERLTAGRRGAPITEPAWSDLEDAAVRLAGLLKHRPAHDGGHDGRQQTA